MDDLLLEPRPVGAGREQHDVLIDVAARGRWLSQRDQAVDAGQRLVVAGGDLAAAGDELVHPAQVHQPGRRVQLTHPPGRAEAHMVVGAEGPLALVPVDPRLVRHVIGPGDHHSALTAGHDLGRVEGERTGHAERTCEPAVERGPVCVRGVLHQGDPALVAQRPQLGDVRGDEPADVNVHDRGGVRGQRRRHGGAVQRQGGHVDVGEHGPPPGLEHRGRGGVEGVRGHDDVPAPHAGHAQRDVQSRGPAGYRHGVWRIVSGREGRLEALSVGAEGERAGGQHFRDRGSHLRPVLLGKDDACCRHSQRITPC